MLNSCDLFLTSKYLSAPGLAFASYYGDHMVLQQAPKRAQIWGYANLTDVGKSIILEVTDTEKSYHKMYSSKVVKGGTKYKLF